MMELDDLPDVVLLNVFRYLPLCQQIRFGRISKHFQDISIAAISQTRSLTFRARRGCDPTELPTHYGRMMPLDSFRMILELCWNRLEEISFCDDAADLVRVFAQFRCPNLVELTLRHVAIDNETFGIIMRNNGNLKSVDWYGLRMFNSNDWIIFPDDVIHENLERVSGRCNATSIMSMIGRCPNLKHFAPKFHSTTPIEADVLDGLFSVYPNIETLELSADWKQLQCLRRSERFWALPLRKLVLNMDVGSALTYSGDSILEKIVASFPQLETFKFPLRVSSRVVGELASLHELVDIELNCGYFASSVVDVGLRELIGYRRLQKLKMGADIEPVTLVALVNGCANLRHLGIHAVKSVASKSNAAHIVKQFNGFGSADLVISLHDSWWVKDIWKSEEVEVVLEELKEKENRVITFLHCEDARKLGL